MHASISARRPGVRALLATLGAATALAVSAAEPAVPLVLNPGSVNGFAEQLRTNHPALRALRNRAAAAEHAVKGVRRFADPMANFGGFVYDQAWMMPEEQGDLTYGIEQQLPIMGKETAARGLAEAEAATEVTRAEARFQELRRDLAKALFNAALAERIVDLGREDLAWLDTTVTAAEARYRGGMGSPTEPLRLQAERARRAAEVESAALRREAARAAVNRLLGGNVAAALPVLALPEVGGPVSFSTNLVRLAERYEPRLQVMERERRVAEATREVTRRSQRPDLALGVQANQFTGDAGIRQGMFTLSLNLPWFNRGKYRQDLLRDEARLRAVSDDLVDERLDVQREVFELTRMIAAARQEALAVRDEVLPRAEATLRTAMASWSNGQGMLLDVLEARRMLVDSKLMLARAIAEQWTAMSELVLCCGLGDLEALQMLGAGEPGGEPQQ